MRLILLLAWRHIVFRPGKTMASVLGIAVGIATVVSVLVVDHNTLTSQAAWRFVPDADADLLIQPDLRSAREVDQAAAELKSHELLRSVTAFATGRFTLAVDGKARTGIQLMAIEAGAESEHGAFVVLEGESLDFLADDPQLLVSAVLAERTGLSVGSTVSLVPPSRGRVRPECIDGQLVPGRQAEARAGGAGTWPFRIVGLLAPTRLGHDPNQVLTSFRVGRDVLGTSLNARFWADFDPSLTDLKDLTGRLGNRYVITAPRRSLAGLAPEERAFRSGVRFCGFLALFLGLYIIFNTMSMSLVERVRSIGLLRSLGLTRTRLLAVFMVEGLALALLGAGVSLLFAHGIVRVFEAQRITTLGFGRPLQVVDVPWGPVLSVLAAGILFCLLGVLYPFLRAARLSVIDALRRGVIELSRDPFTGVRRSVLVGLLAVVPLAWMVGNPSGEYVPEPLYRGLLIGFALVGGAFALLLLAPGLLSGLGRLLSAPLRGVAAALARTTLGAARHRVFATVSGLMLVFMAVFLVVTVLESLKGEIRDFGRAALSERIFLRTTAEGARLLPRLRQELPELALMPLNAEVTSTFLVRGIDPRMLSMSSLAEDAELRRAFVEEPTLILSTRCADDFDKRPGDLVRMATASGAGRLVDFRVLAVSDEIGFAPDDRIFGLVSTHTMREYWCVDGAGLGDWFVAWTPGLGEAGARDLAARVEEVLGADNVLDLRRGESITASYVADLDRDFLIFYAILALTVLLAAAGILNAMVIAVMERRREIGLLRAVGLTGGQVAGMLLVESGVLGVLGGLLGLVLGIPLAFVTTRTLTAVSHLDLAFQLSPRALGAVLAGAVLVSTLAILLPALRANRLRLSAVMRYE